MHNGHDSSEMNKRDARIRAAALREYAQEAGTGSKPADLSLRLAAAYPRRSGQFGAVTQPSNKGSCKRKRQGLPKNVKEWSRQVLAQAKRLQAK
jgi:hypothetical protein